MPITTSGSTPNNFLYSGEQYDSALGMYYLRARYYNPATGRFWARDPIEGKLCCGLSSSPYIYTEDNPVNALDPTGRDVLESEVLWEGIRIVHDVLVLRTLGECYETALTNESPLAGNGDAEVLAAGGQSVAEKLAVCVMKATKEAINPPFIPLIK